MQCNSEPDMQSNSPDLWKSFFPVATREDHKYTRGHAIILGGKASHSGASLLASEAALRAGAGLVSLLVPPESLNLYALAARKAVIKRNSREILALLEDKRPQAWLIGPGLGVLPETQEVVALILPHKKPTVLDADALTVFGERPEFLFSLLHPQCLLTPHEGEFLKLFPDLKGSKVERAREGAKRSGAIVLLKGAETVIAHPDGSVIVNNADAPQLATAGSGDVLAGLCAGLLAQGMPVFLAAAAASWLHARTAERLGRGMIADDLLTELPQVLRVL